MIELNNRLGGKFSERRVRLFTGLLTLHPTVSLSRAALFLKKQKPFYFVLGVASEQCDCFRCIEKRFILTWAYVVSPPSSPPIQATI